jgi:hypothetical protein
MKKTILLLLLCLTSFFGKSQTCIDTIAFDNMETFDWPIDSSGFGDWFQTFAPVGNTTTTNVRFFNNASVSTNASAVIYGAGPSGSFFEQDWYVMPNITGLNPTSTHRFSFRLASYVFSSPAAATRGVDIDDFVEVQLSTNGGVTYFGEMRIRGRDNAFWDYNNLGVASDTANGVLRIFTPNVLGPRVNRTSTGDGFSVIQLTIPPGPTQIAVDILCRINSAGEEWWIDNVLLEEIYNCIIFPIELIYFGTEYDKNNKDVIVSWRASTTELGEYFIIEKSLDSYTFDSIGIVYPTEIGTNNFQFVDESPIYNGYTYYRLKMVENSTHNYSNVSVVEVKDFVNKIIVHPNPFNDYIKVQNLGDYYGLCEIKIYDVVGKEVISQSFQFGIINKMEINTKDLSPGIYNVVVKTNGSTETYKIIK